MGPTTNAGHSRRRGAALWWVLAVVVAAGLGVVFGRWAFLPPAVEAYAAEPSTVAVVEVTVGRSVPVVVSAVWEVVPFGVGAASGTLTTLEVADRDVVEAGQVVFTVDLRPVVAAVGEVPAFRDLAAGVRGADVEQLQRFLTDAGYFRGVVDGRFGAGTTAAVREWQRGLGVPVDGVVRAGDLLFTSSLPARVVLGDDVAVGRRVSEGEVVLSVLSEAPGFWASPQVDAMVDPSLPIAVTVGDELVVAVVAGVERDEWGGSRMALTRADGSPVCGDGCDLVSLIPADAVFAARQVVTAEVSGPGVPAAAVHFDAAGNASLVTPEGVRLPVSVVEQGQGQVVLDGVEVGTVVVLAGEPGAG